MIKVELNNASNGVIKKVITPLEKECSLELLKVYELDPESSESYLKTIKTLITDIILDMALEVGSDYSSEQMKIDIDWGPKYSPSIEEINEKIKKLSKEIKDLKRLKNVNNV